VAAFKNISASRCFIKAEKALGGFIDRMKHDGRLFAPDEAFGCHATT